MRLALLRLARLRLAALTLLALFALRRLRLRRALLTLGPAGALALIALPLARGLVPVALAALGLSLVALAVDALRSLILLRRLARGLIF